MGSNQVKKMSNQEEPHTPDVFIGSIISVITKYNFRYEGSLFRLDQNRAEITLKNVRIWGTEDRSPGSDVPPSLDMLDEIVIRSQDIEELYVIPQFTPLPSHPFEDPAVVRATATMQSQYHQQKQQQEHQPHQQISSQKHQQSPVSINNDGDDEKQYSGPGTSNYLKWKTGGGALVIPENEFDFQQSNARFDKQAVMDEVERRKEHPEESSTLDNFSEVADDVQKQDSEIGQKSRAEPMSPALSSSAVEEPPPELMDIQPKYDGSSFFDDLQESSRDKNYDRGAARKANLETFGDSALPSGGYNGRYGARGRGSGRGRGGGRGREGGRGRWRGGRESWHRGGGRKPRSEDRQFHNYQYKFHDRDLEARVESLQLDNNRTNSGQDKHKQERDKHQEESNSKKSTHNNWRVKSRKNKKVASSNPSKSTSDKN